MKKESEDLVKPRFDSKRFLFGIIFGIIIVLSIFLLGKIEFFFICIIFISLSVHELYSIVDLNEYKYFIIPEILSILIGFSSVFLSPAAFALIFTLSVFLLWFKNVLTFKKDGGKTLFLDTFSVLYTGLFISFLSKIFDLGGGRLMVLLLFILVWSSDIFAYYGGRHFGKRKLFVSLSPKKTVEGALIGFFTAIAVAFIFRIFIKDYQRFNMFQFAILTGLTVIIGMIGDLTESLIKRIGNKKDSGTLIPGHGGILDRIDSLILAAPFFYYMIKLFL